MKINEIFYSVQGEGKTIGQPRLFIRLSGCNLNCAFCDTKYHEKVSFVDYHEIEVYKECRRWVITGGEPLLQQEEIVSAIKEYNPEWVEIETNGTITPLPELAKLVDLWNISPKEPSIVIKTLKSRHIEDFILKTVYQSSKSESWIKKLERYTISDNFYIMPEGATKAEQEDKMQQVIDFCLKNNYNFSPRLHVLVWGDERGV